MRTYLMAVGFALVTLNGNAQFWNDTGNPSVIPGTNFLGSTNNATLEFLTNNVLRMRLLPTNTTQTIGSYTNQTVSGNLGVGQFSTTNVTLPWSLLHLDNGGNQFSGYRPWHRPGMTITNGTDLGWIGLKNEGGDINHFTLAWADNTATQGPDLFKVIFLANPGTTGTAGTVNGLETMRILPLASGVQSYVGIGDFFSLGVNPTERMHILNGRERIQQLPDDPAATMPYKVMVVDDSPSPSGERGVVKWVDPNSLGGGGNCTWTLQPNNDVATAYTGNPCPPQDVNYVGIGIDRPTSKLHVVANQVAPGGSFIAADVINTIPTTDENGSDYVGVRGITADYFVPPAQVPTQYYGGRFYAFNATKYNVGVDGQAGVIGGDFTSPLSIGARGEAAPPQSGADIGVQGNCTGNGSGGEFNGYNGARGLTVNGMTYLNGDLWCTGTPYSRAGGLWQVSDQALKTNPELIVNASERLIQLEPKTFDFLTDAYPSLNLPEGQQAGFYAQELADVFPGLVKETVVPAQVDSLGNESVAEMPIHVINEIGLVPYLVAGFQEQQALIGVQQDHIAAQNAALAVVQEQLALLQEQVAACCPAGTDHRALHAVQGTGSSNTIETDLRIIPNPVADRTELRYTVGTEGSVRLSIAAPDGRNILVQDEGTRATGTYSYGWDTTALAPGTYHCTLYVNGELVVRKAVKLNSR